MAYRIPLNTSIAQDTMAKIDKIKKKDGGMLSRGEVIDKAVALYADAQNSQTEAAK